MPKNTNSMLSTLRKLRKMKDPEGYIRSLKTEKELLQEFNFSLAEKVVQVCNELEYSKDERSKDNKLFTLYFITLVIAFALSHL